MSIETPTGQKSPGTSDDDEPTRYEYCKRCDCQRPTIPTPASDRPRCIECGIIVKDNGERPETGHIRLVEGCQFSTIGAGGGGQ